MKILLIGAAGQLGRELVTSLQPCGRLVATARAGSGLPADCETHPLDLADTTAIGRLLDEVRPDLVVNAAAYTAVDKAETDLAAAQAANVDGVRALAQKTVELDAALIHYSTDYVFNGGGTKAWREDDPIEPLNAYGRGKAAGENAIRSSGARHLIQRVCWLYGPYGQNFVKKMFELAATRDEISVVDDQIGAPTSARFVADVTRRIVAQASNDANLFERRGGNLHVACGGETSWFGFAQAIFAQSATSGLPVRIPRLRPIASSAFPTPAKRPLNSRLDTTRLARDFGIEPVPWEIELQTNLAQIHAEFVARAAGNQGPL